MEWATWTDVDGKCRHCGRSGDGPSVPESELHELIDAIIDLASAIRSLDKAKGGER